MNAPILHLDGLTAGYDGVALSHRYSPSQERTRSSSERAGTAGD